jgi:acyl-CoA dehydrogenase
MLMTMRALTEACRAMAFTAAASSDAAHAHPDALVRRRNEALYDFLVPLVKGYSTEMSLEVTSLGVQVHGGMGFIEETGAAQHYRDARIAQIYEGTNGIQAIDLVTRKLPMEGGAVVRRYLDELRRTVTAVQARNDPAFGATGARLNGAVDSLDRATTWLLATLDKSPDAALAGATPYLRLFAAAAGGCALAEEALAGIRLSDADAAGRVALARFFAENIAVQASGLETTVTEGADSVSTIALA